MVLLTQRTDEVHQLNYEMQLLAERTQELEEQKNDLKEDVIYLNEQLREEREKLQEQELLIEKLAEQAQRDEEFKAALAQQQIEYQLMNGEGLTDASISILDEGDESQS